MSIRTRSRTIASTTSPARARRHPLAQGVAVALTVLTLGACSSSDDDDEDTDTDTDNPGVTDPGTTTPGGLVGMDGSPAGSFAVVANDGTTPGSVTFYSPDLATRASTLATGANEGIAFGPDGTLYQNADADSFTGLRRFPDAASRADNDGFDEANAGDATIGAAPGKGLVYVAAGDGLLASCDVTDDAAPLKLFATDGTPVDTFDLGGAKCWDTFYAAEDDRLYVALTDGRLGVFDEFSGEYADGEDSDTDSDTDTDTDAGEDMDAGEGADSDGALDRIVTPVDAAGAVLSTNLHGVFVEGDTVLVSDVGDAASPTDGLLFTFTDDGSLDGNVETAGIGGPATMLGNPVDVVLLDGNAIVAEKSNDVLLVFGDVTTLSGDVMPTYSAAFTKPESIELAPTPADGETEDGDTEEGETEDGDTDGGETEDGDTDGGETEDGDAG